MCEVGSRVFSNRIFLLVIWIGRKTQGSTWDLVFEHCAKTVAVVKRFFEKKKQNFIYSLYRRAGAGVHVNQARARTKSCSRSMSYAQPHRGKEPPLSDYFASPIRTLCESVKDSEQNFISDHDIVEAYNVICWRIRSRKSDIPKMKIEGLFSNFEDDVPLLVQCISRDILRVLPNPFESVPHRGQSVYQSYNTDNATSEDDLAATDHTLCQNALRLMSDLFMFPSLYSMFSRE